MNKKEEGDRVGKNLRRRGRLARSGVERTKGEKLWMKDDFLQTLVICIRYCLHCHVIQDIVCRVF